MISSLLSLVEKENERSGDRETEVDGTIFMSQRRPCAKVIGGHCRRKRSLPNAMGQRLFIYLWVENFIWRVVGNENGKVEGWLR